LKVEEKAESKKLKAWVFWMPDSEYCLWGEMFKLVEGNEALH
jgi:hypothetical protein